MNPQRQQDGYVQSQLPSFTESSFVANSFEAQAPKAFGDIDFFLGAPSVSASSSSNGAPRPGSHADETQGLRRELSRLQATMSQMETAHAAERGFMQTAYAAERGLRDEVKTESQQHIEAHAREAQQAEMRTSEAANAMLRDFMKTESATVGDLSKSEQSWHQKAQLESNALKASGRREEGLARKLKQAEGALVQLSSAQVLRNKRREARLAKPRELCQLQSCLQHNIAREMRTAREGLVLQKVDERRGASSDRLVMVDDNTMELRWGHIPTGWLNPTMLNPLALRANLLAARGKMQSMELKDVIRIEYGRASRAWAIDHETHAHTNLSRRKKLSLSEIPQAAGGPWLCFSLYTTERSYDFICPDEWAAQVMVLVISRLLPGVNGSVHSRRKFKALKGWCKVQDFCIKENKTLPRMLLEALKVCSPNDGSPISLSKGPNPFSFRPGPNMFSFRPGPGKANPFSFHTGACGDEGDAT